MALAIPLADAHVDHDDSQHGGAGGHHAERLPRHSG